MLRFVLKSIFRAPTSFFFSFFTFFLRGLIIVFLSLFPIFRYYVGGGDGGGNRLYFSFSHFSRMSVISFPFYIDNNRRFSCIFHTSTILLFILPSSRDACATTTPEDYIGKLRREEKTEFENKTVCFGFRSFGLNKGRLEGCFFRLY